MTSIDVINSRESYIVVGSACGIEVSTMVHCYVDAENDPEWDAGHFAPDERKEVCVYSQQSVQQQIR